MIIALDRLLTVISTSHHRPERAHKRTKLMLIGAWITALLISAPQFAVWRVFTAFPQWDQCMSVGVVLEGNEIDNASRFGKSFVLKL